MNLCPKSCTTYCLNLILYLQVWIRIRIRNMDPQSSWIWIRYGSGSTTLVGTKNREYFEPSNCFKLRKNPTLCQWVSNLPLCGRLSNSKLLGMETNSWVCRIMYPSYCTVPTTNELTGGLSFSEFSARSAVESVELPNLSDYNLVETRIYFTSKSFPQAWSFQMNAFLWFKKNVKQEF